MNAIYLFWQDGGWRGRRQRFIKCRDVFVFLVKDISEGQKEKKNQERRHRVTNKYLEKIERIVIKIDSGFDIQIEPVSQFMA